MKTKALVRFLNRAAHFEADIELADVIAIASKGGILNTEGSAHLFDAINPTQHPRLAARVNNDANRLLSVRHLKSTLAASFIKEMYEDFTLYMQEILEAAAAKGLDPNRLIGEHKVTLSANDCLRAGSWAGVARLVAQSLFQQLQNERSTKELLRKMNVKLDLGVPEDAINDALPYLDLRHLLVHEDGIANATFAEDYPVFGATTGDKVQLDHGVLQKAKVAVLRVIEEFDQKIVGKGVVSASELQP